MEVGEDGSAEVHQHVDTEELLCPVDEEGGSKTATELQLAVVPEQGDPVDLSFVAFLTESSHNF